MPEEKVAREAEATHLPDTRPFERTGRLMRTAARVLRGPTPVVLLAIATVALAVWGLARIPGENLSVSDTAYSVLQLFNLDFAAPEGGTPWQLDVARFLAPAVVAYAVLVAFLALARDQIQAWRTRLLARGHVVIVGVGARGSELARALRGSRKVVCIERDAANGSAKSLRETGIPVLVGDGRDGESLRAARAERAAHVVLVTSDDSSNLEALAALRRILDPDSSPVIHAAIEAPGLWSELHRLPLQKVGAPKRVEFISIPDRTAQLLVERALEHETVTGAATKAVIRGEGPTVARLAVHLLRSPMFKEGRPELVLDVTDDAETRALLRDTDRWVFDDADVSAWDEGGSERPADAAFVCGLGEAEALDAAIVLTRRIAADAPVHVEVRDADTQDALAAAGVDFDRLNLVSVGEILYDEAFLEDAAVERMARAKHADYLINLRKNGADPRDEEAMLPWEDLDETFRESNRAYVDGVAEKLAKLNADLVPLTGRSVGNLRIPEQTFEELAKEEHERWCRERKHNKWSYGPVKDRNKKTHPDLKSWKQLSKASRDKDRDGVRLLPELFAAVGYELVLPGDAPPPAER